MFCGSVLWFRAQLVVAPERRGGPSTDPLEEAVSLAHHHDGVTGTSKQHVADDYNMRISRGDLHHEPESMCL